MLGGLAPRLKSLKLADTTLLLTRANTTLAVNQAGAFTWTATHNFNSLAQFNSTTYFYTYPYFWSGAYNYGTFYNYGAQNFPSQEPGHVAYFDAARNIYGNTNFFYDEANRRLGVQTTTPSAVGHFKSDLGTSPALLSGVSVTLALSPVITAPVYYYNTQIAGHLYAASSFGNSVFSDATSYMAGDSIQYRITAYSNSGSNTYSVVSSSTTASIANGTGAADGDRVDLSWSHNTSGSESISGYIIERNVNSGGWSDGVDVGNTTYYSDYGTGWGGVSLSPAYSDFIANGTSRNFSAHSVGTDPNSNVLYSAATYDVTFTDDNTGNPYIISHYGYGSYDLRIVDTTNALYADLANYGTLLEDTTTFVAGSASPTTYGYLADGSGNLTRDYDFYNFDGTYYSLTSGVYSTVDPNDSQYYYVDIQYSGVLTSAKVLRQINGGGYNDARIDTVNFYDDNVVTFPDSTTVTPNSSYVPAGKFENNSGTVALLGAEDYAIDTNGSARLEGLDSGAGAPGTILTSYVLYVDTATGIVYCQ